MQKPQKKALVILPFYSLEDSEKQAYFRDLLQIELEPTLAELGYTTQIAENYVDGSVSKSLNHGLASADLALISLTDLNPNIFSKLTIREKLKNRPTILLLDERFEAHPRFDVTRYPVIRHGSRHHEAGHLRQQLIMQISELNNSVSLSQAIKIEGITERTRDEPSSPEIELSRAIIDSYNEFDPERLLKRAEEAIARTPPDLNVFLVDCVSKFIVPDTFTPSDYQYIRMEVLASDDRVNLTRISFALLQKAKELYPDSRIVELYYLMRHAHSNSRQDRLHARSVIMHKYGMRLTRGSLKMASGLRSLHDFRLVSFLLDALHGNQTMADHNNALIIARTLKERYSQSSIMMRNYARALMFTNRASKDQVLEFYQRAIFCADVDYLSTNWYARSLMEAGRLIDAVEVLIFACMLNIDNADNFAQLALEMSNIIQPTNAFLHKRAVRAVPACYTDEAVLHLIWLCKTCMDYSEGKNGPTCTAALRNVGRDLDDMRTFYESTYGGGDISRPDRSRFIMRLYESEGVRTVITDESQGRAARTAKSRITRKTRKAAQ